MATKNFRFPTQKTIDGIKNEEIDRIISAADRKLAALSERAVSEPVRGYELFRDTAGYGGIKFRGNDDNYYPRRFVSAEIELNKCSATNVMPFKDAWRDIVAVCSDVKFDGSVSGDGLELNTMPAKGGVFHKQMDLLKSSFKKIHSAANTTCGLHIHVDVRDFTGTELFKLANIWSSIENDVIKLIRPSRRNNHFSKPLPQNLKESWLSKKFKLDTANDPARNIRRIQETFGYDRYRNLNFQAYDAHRTVEFRLHHGTANVDLIRYWCILCSEIVQYAKICSVSRSRTVKLENIIKSKKLQKFVASKMELNSSMEKSSGEDIFNF